MKEKIKELNEFELMDMLDNENNKEENIKIFSTLEMIDYCLKNNVKSKIIPSITEIDEEGSRYLYFNSEGNLANEITKEDLDNKYAIKIKEKDSVNVLDRKFKKGYLWVRDKRGAGISPFNTLEKTIRWISEMENDIYEVYYKDSYGHETVLARKIKE